MAQQLKRPRVARRLNSQQGFSLIEVMIAMVLLMVGLLGILAMFATGISAAQHAQEDVIAKQKAQEALEAVYSSRNDANTTFAQIQNAPTGIYKSGPDPLYHVVPNSTGILGTTTEGNTLDWVYAPDPVTGQLTVIVPLTNYRRTIAITPVPDATGAPNPNLRSVQVTVTVYKSAAAAAAGTGSQRSYVVTGYISAFH